jgi:hypothetical protein
MAAIIMVLPACKTVVPDGWTDSEIFSHGGVTKAQGWKRGNFGVIEFPHHCTVPYEVDFVIFLLVHIASGYTLAIFNSVEAATLAAELCERCADFSVSMDDIDVETNRANAERCRALWKQAGIKPSPFEDPDGDPVWGMPRPLNQVVS